MIGRLRRIKYCFASVSVLAALLSVVTQATADITEPISSLEREWAAISYQSPEAARKADLDGLLKQAQFAVKQFPGRAEPLAWHAIILCSYAEAVGGLTALDSVKQSRDLLLQAAEIDEVALGGTINGYLGMLYSKVPGWPIGFGDDKKANSYFQRALAVDVAGIDTNYFYGHYLLNHGKKREARTYLQKALNHPLRSDHAAYDAGRRLDIETDLVKANGY